MTSHFTAYIIIILMFLSCKNEKSKPYDSSVIDREKIDRQLVNDVSQVLFNHLYVVVDSLTYAQLKTDGHLKNTYASIDAGLPNFGVINENTSTCYLRGHQHYIEILGPNNTYNEPVGKSGVGFSLQNNDSHFHLGIQPKLKASEATVLNASETVKIPLSKNEHTWFKAFYTPSKGTALHTWYAFYNPSFLKHLNGTSHQHYSREMFLKTSYSEDKLFKGIKKIELLCTENDFFRIGHELRNLGCKLVGNEGKSLTISAGDVDVTITPSKDIAYSRITRIYCRLNAKDQSYKELGNVTITNNGTESIWRFDALHQTETK